MLSGIRFLRFLHLKCSIANVLKLWLCEPLYLPALRATGDRPPEGHLKGRLSAEPRRKRDDGVGVVFFGTCIIHKRAFLSDDGYEERIFGKWIGKPTKKKRRCGARLRSI